jgi:DNA/RNA-binding domain of Phe-tRNA-synthetase-like protein
MDFGYAEQIKADFPELAVAALVIEGVNPALDVAGPIAGFTAVAKQRLGSGSESDLPEVQAWRRAFARMGLKPTQYRSASEALLRRFRKEGALPSIHPLVDLCNAVSLAFAIPVAAVDTAMMVGRLEVRRATGNEAYEAFSGEIEHPDPGEVIYADEGGHAHARRWTNRQSGRSAIRKTTATALIVAEALHASAREDVERLIDALAAALAQIEGVRTVERWLSRAYQAEKY